MHTHIQTGYAMIVKLFVLHVWNVSAVTIHDIWRIQKISEVIVMARAFYESAWFIKEMYHHIYNACDYNYYV